MAFAYPSISSLVKSYTCFVAVFKIPRQWNLPIRADFSLMNAGSEDLCGLCKCFSVPTRINPYPC